jgi:hypothetical protein
MNFNNYYFLKENVNKFNPAWQIVRTEARDIKDVDKKISFVLNFLNRESNKHNYGRVHNWLRMTKLGYKSEPDKAEKFDKALDKIESNKEKYSSEEDTNADVSSMSDSNLKKVYNDLKKRKYGFQIKTVPKAHTQFLNQLEREIEKRKLS